MKARIVKADERNFAVQVLKTLTNPKTKQSREEWVDEGYFGHRLDHAAEFVLLRGFAVDDPITPKDVKAAVAGIVAQTKAALRGTVTAEEVL